MQFVTVAYLEHVNEVTGCVPGFDSQQGQRCFPSKLTSNFVATEPETSKL